MGPKLDQEDPGATERRFAFSYGAGPLAPPLTGLLDATIDWRDRQLSFVVEVDTVDVRWGRGGDGRPPLGRYAGGGYTRLGSAFVEVTPTGSVRLYVDALGRLFLSKEDGVFVRGIIEAPCQTGERS